MSGPTLTEQLQSIVSEYLAAGQTWPATTREIAGWAIRAKLWQPHPDSAVAQCAEQLAGAMREEYIVDDQGRHVRAKHAARIEQKVLWDDIRTAPRDHMEIAFQQRRQQIVGDCHQLRTDADSYNDNANPGVAIQLVFDFTADLAELDASRTLEALAVA